MRGIASCITLLCALTASHAIAAPTVDGQFDPNEGYTTGIFLDFHVEKGPTVTGGSLWTYQDPITGDVFVYFSQPLTLVDNTYGANSIGWGSNAPSGKNHKFDDLVGSDKAQFQFTDALGNVVLDFSMDYITKSGSNYVSLGATGGDGKVHTGSAASLLAWGTTLDYNFNTLGHVLIKDSPATDNNYTENPSYPGWIWEVGYEMQISGNLFTNGFGDVSVVLVHDSPNKLGGNKVTTTPDGVIPEPASLALLGLGSLCLLRRPRRADGR